MHSNGVITRYQYGLRFFSLDTNAELPLNSPMQVQFDRVETLQTWGPNPANWHPTQNPPLRRWIKALDIVNTLDVFYEGADALWSAWNASGRSLSDTDQARTFDHLRSRSAYDNVAWWTEYLEGIYTAFEVSSLSRRFMLYPRFHTLSRDDQGLISTPEVLFTLRVIVPERTEQGFAATRVQQAVSAAYMGWLTGFASGIRTAGGYSRQEIRFGPGDLLQIVQYDDAAATSEKAERMLRTIKNTMAEEVFYALGDDAEWRAFSAAASESWTQRVQQTLESKGVDSPNVRDPLDAALALGYLWADKVAMRAELPRGCSDVSQALRWQLVWTELPGNEMGGEAKKGNRWLTKVLANRFQPEYERLKGLGVKLP